MLAEGPNRIGFTSYRELVVEQLGRDPYRHTTKLPPQDRSRHAVGINAPLSPPIEEWAS